MISAQATWKYIRDLFQEPPFVLSLISVVCELIKLYFLPEVEPGVANKSVKIYLAINFFILAILSGIDLREIPRIQTTAGKILTVMESVAAFTLGIKSLIDLVLVYKPHLDFPQFEYGLITSFLFVIYHALPKSKKSVRSIGQECRVLIGMSKNKKIIHEVFKWGVDEPATTLALDRECSNVETFEVSELCGFLTAGKAILKVLPDQLEDCLNREAYDDANLFLEAANMISNAFEGSFLQIFKLRIDSTIEQIVLRLKAIILLESETIQARTNAVAFLQRVGSPLDELQSDLLGRLCTKTNALEAVFTNFGNPTLELSTAVCHEADVHAIAYSIKAFRALFPTSHQQVLNTAKNLVSNLFEIADLCMKIRESISDSVELLRISLRNVSFIAATLSDPSVFQEDNNKAIEACVVNSFGLILKNIKGILLKNQVLRNQVLTNEVLTDEVLTNEVLTNIVPDPLLAREQRHRQGKKLEESYKASKKLLLDGISEAFLLLRQLLLQHPEHVSFLVNLVAKKALTKFLMDLHDEMCKLKAAEPGSASFFLLGAQLSSDVAGYALDSITKDNPQFFAPVPAESGKMFYDMFHILGLDFLDHYIELRSRMLAVYTDHWLQRTSWNKADDSPSLVGDDLFRFLLELESAHDEVSQISPLGGKPAASDCRYTRVSVLTRIVCASFLDVKEKVLEIRFTPGGFKQVQVDLFFLKFSLEGSDIDTLVFYKCLDEVLNNVALRFPHQRLLSSKIMEEMSLAKMDNKLAFIF